MERIFQDHSGDIPFVNNKTIEEFFCVFTLVDETETFIPGVFWLKTREDTRWHRFFLDAWLAYWEIFDELAADVFDDPEDFIVMDLTEVSRLAGTRITRVTAEQLEWRNTPSTGIRIMFSSGQELRVYENDDHSELFIGADSSLKDHS